MQAKRIVTLASALLALGLLLAPLAAAGKSPRVRNGVVHACVKTKGKRSQRGTIRIVNSARQCKRKKGEQALTWSLLGAGATGGTGTAGATSPQGTMGPTGPAGEKGAQGEKGAAATIESQLKETIVTQTKDIEDLTGKVLGLEHELEVGLEKAKTSVTDLGTNLNNTINGVKTDLGNEIGDVAGNLGSFETTTNQSIANVQSTTATLTGEIAKQCSSLSEVVTQANGLGGAFDELLGVGAVKTLLGGVLPKVPTETKAVTC